MQKLLLALVFVGCSSMAAAQKFVFQGLGNYTCGEAMQQISGGSLEAEKRYTDWVGGFISGYNSAIVQTQKVDAMVGHGLSFDTLTALFKNKCALDAQKMVIQAAQEIYQELAERQQQ